MGAKSSGEPARTPVKASTQPSEGKGDCSGKRTLAEKWPSPTSDERHSPRASELVEGSMWPRRQRGRPARSSRPARLKAKLTRCSCGGPPAAVEEIWQTIETAIGAVP